jgi:hypothetical protein
MRTSTTDPCATTLSAIEAAAPSLNPKVIALTVTINTTVESGPNCTTGAALLQSGQPVTVSATYPCSLAIYGTTFTNACQLSAKVTEYEY